MYTVKADSRPADNNMPDCLVRSKNNNPAATNSDAGNMNSSAKTNQEGKT